MDFDKISIAQDGIFVNNQSHGLFSGILAFLKRIAEAIASSFRWSKGVLTSAIILGLLFFIVINFYIFSSIVNLNSFFYGFLFLSLLTDGAFILLHLPRRKVQHAKLAFDPSKVTVLIACYNGAPTIAETIRQAAKHVPVNQIVVVSDASTDNTAEIAKAAGATVIQNPRNMHKAFSVSIGMKEVKTPYVLVLDDDTFIGNAMIPTNLLDEGYSAVAFNVMPVKEKSLINELQQFEYRQSMQLGKNYRATSGSIGNVSGAIGLFRTEDLVNQVTQHSGQFAGEDEQRTVLVHLLSKGKGITYTDSVVYTNPPDTYRSLYQQRAYKWSAALPEMFTLYWRILLSPRYNYMLKTEKAYQLYYYFTDPLRILFIWTLFTRSSHLVVLYIFYLALNSLIWAKLRFQASLRAVLLYPFYSIFLIICRFIGHAYWLYLKFHYMTKRLYRYAQHRHLMFEYSLVIIAILFIWTISVLHFGRDLSLLNKINSHSLNNTASGFNYDKMSPYVASATQAETAPVTADYVLVPVETGDTQRAIAYKAIYQYLIQQSNIPALQTEHVKAYSYLATQIPNFDSSQPSQTIHVDKSAIQQALNYETAGQ